MNISNINVKNLLLSAGIMRHTDYYPIQLALFIRYYIFILNIYLAILFLHYLIHVASYEVFGKIKTG